MSPAYPQVFHVGMPRSGSTTLQSILREDPRVDLVQSRFFWDERWWSEPYAHRDTGAAVRVESTESLVRQGPLRRCKLPLTIERIAHAVPDARIIVVVREQRSLLLSRYKFAIERGQGTDLERWLLSTHGLDVVSAASYGALYRTLQAFFPAGQLSILLFEDLRSDFDSFVSGFYAVLGIDPPDDASPRVRNPSLPDDVLVSLRRLNRFRGRRESGARHGAANRRAQAVARALTPVLARGDTAIEWPKSPLARSIEEDFRHSNRSLATSGAISLDRLAEAGYLL